MSIDMLMLKIIFLKIKKHYFNTFKKKTNTHPNIYINNNNKKKNQLDVTTTCVFIIGILMMLSYYENIVLTNAIIMR